MARNQGFSLLEISIVLAIIGLLVGGITLGSVVYRQTQLNTVVTDEQNYVTAIKIFQQKYGMLPGDFNGATNLWGVAGGNSSDNWTATCYGSGSATSPATCNGNGNGQIANNAENVLVWKHLSNAQMIKGKFTGVPGPAGANDNIPGTNVPRSSSENSGYGILYIGSAGSSSIVFPGSYGHTIDYGAYTSNSTPVNATLTASEALALDTKYDDGLPGTGNIRIILPSYTNPNCATTSVASTAAYKVTATGPVCSLFFITGF